MDPLKDIDWNEVWKAQMRRNRESSPGRDCARIWESRESALRFWKCAGKREAASIKPFGRPTPPRNHASLTSARVPEPWPFPLPKSGARHCRRAGRRHGQRDAGEDGGIWSQEHHHSAEALGGCGCRRGPATAVRCGDSIILAGHDGHTLGHREDDGGLIKVHLPLSLRRRHPWDGQWSELWPRLHGREYHPGPKCDVLYNVLYQMGIYPHIRTFRLEHNQPYSSLDEAVSTLSPQAQGGDAGAEGHP